MNSAGATVVKMTSRVCEALRVGFRSNNTEAYFHMSHSLMCSDGLFEQHFLSSSTAALKCQNITSMILCIHPEYSILKVYSCAKKIFTNKDSKPHVSKKCT